MDQAKEDLYKQEAKKSKEGNFRTSFYYVNSTEAEALGLSEYKAKKGDNFIRIVSPDITKFWGLEVFKHSNVGANRATFLCIDKMFGEKCPVCQKIEEFKQADPADPRIKALYPGRRFLLFVVDVTNESTEAEGVKYFDCPVTIKDSIMGLCEDKRTGKWKEIENPDTGCDIEFTRSGSGKMTRYTGFKLIETDPIPEEWTEDLPDFTDILLIPDPAIMEEEVTGLAAESVEETSSQTGEKRSRRRKSEPVEEEVVDVVVEEEPSNRRRRTRRSSVEETVAPEDSVEDVEEVEEKPSTASPASGKLTKIQQKIAEMKKKRQESN